MTRIVRDGKVAVLYSLSTSGWYTAHGISELLFDPKLVEIVETAHQEYYDCGWDIIDYCEANYPYFTMAFLDSVERGDSLHLAIEWVPVGALFRIEQYDGQEEVVVMDPEDYHTA